MPGELFVKKTARKDNGGVFVSIENDGRNYVLKNMQNNLPGRNNRQSPALDESHRALPVKLKPEVPIASINTVNLAFLAV